MPKPMLTASAMFANAARFADAYHTAIAPLCASTGLPPAAADILLFLANNPGRDTARDICTYRKLKPAIVSFHVDKLAREGYLLRQAVPGDRRKCRLVPTEKAALVIAQGRALQERFSRQLVRGLTAEDAAHFERCLTVIGDNMTAMAEDRRKNEGV